MEKSIELLQKEIQLLDYLINSTQELLVCMQGRLCYSSVNSLNDAIIRLELEKINRENDIHDLRII
jgi:hypothetical protein